MSSKLSDVQSAVSAITPPVRKRLPSSLLGLIAALILLMLVAASSSVAWQQYSAAAKRTRLTIDQIRALGLLMRDVEESENLKRGYLLTGQRRYLDRFWIVKPRIPRKLFEMVALDSSSQHIVGELRAAVFQSMARELNPESLASEIRKKPAALMQEMDGSYERLMRERRLADELDSQLNDRLAELRLTTRAYAQLSQWIATVGCFGIFVIVLLANTQIRRLLRKRASLNDKLQRTNEDLQQFIFSASHDLQEPLRTLRIYSDLIENKMRVGRAVDRDLLHLRSAATHMSALIQDLLVYSQLEHKTASDSSEFVDLSRIAADVVSSLEALVVESKAQITLSSLPRVGISATHATQLLQNLLTNAIRYREQSRTCEIRISAAQLPARFWTISVQDNGIGIKPQYRELVFGIFKRLHTRSEHEGTGLGLAICKKIVERYGGRIWVESSPGEGSTFSFTIPEMHDKKRLPGFSKA